MTSLGEYRVGVKFNPDGSYKVDLIKKAAADLIDLIYGLDNQEKAPAEVARLRALAMTAIEEGAMWAVKAVTEPPRDE